MALSKAIQCPFVQQSHAVGTTHLLVSCHQVYYFRATVMVQETFILFNGSKFEPSGGSNVDIPKIS